MACGHAGVRVCVHACVHACVFVAVRHAYRVLRITVSLCRMLTRNIPLPRLVCAIVGSTFSCQEYPVYVCCHSYFFVSQGMKKRILACATPHCMICDICYVRTL